MKPFCFELAISTTLREGIGMDNLVTFSKAIKEDKIDNVIKPSRIIKEDKIKDVQASVTIVENLCIGQENVNI
jgi:hypothetical protein